MLPRSTGDCRGVGVPRHPEPAHRLPARRIGLHLVVQGTGRTTPGRHLRHPGRGPSVLPAAVRLDVQGLRDTTWRGPDRSYLRRSDRLAGRPRLLRRRAGAPDRAFDRVSGRVPPVSAGRPPRFHDRADSGRLVSRPDGARDRSDRGSRGPAVHRGAADGRGGRGKKVAYIGGIDLCHVGPEFGDPSPVDPGLQEQVRRFDGEMLDRAAACDPEGWFRTAGAVGNRWRVCGLAATYTMLHAIGPSRGRLLKYEQALDDRRTCCVSFASMAFHASEPAPAVPTFEAHVQFATAAAEATGAVPDHLEPGPGGGDAAPSRPPCPAPADFRAEVAALRRGGRGRALGRSALPDDLSGPRRRARRCS